MKNCLIFFFCLLVFLPLVICEELPPLDDWSDVAISNNSSYSPDDWSDVNLSNDSSFSDNWSDVNLSNEEINKSSFAQTNIPTTTSTSSLSKYSNINKKIVNLVTTGNIDGVKTGAYYFALVMAGVFFFILALLIYLVFFKH